MSRATIPCYVVGAYTASPSGGGWDPVAEGRYFASLAADARVGALELPWQGALHAHDEEWLFAHLPPHVDAVLTDVAHVFLTTRDRPRYGLASTDGEERANAVEDARRLHDDVRRLNDRVGRRAVRAVELHAGPRADRAAAAPLAASLAELASWAWDDAELVVEHCDALVPGREPEKGFLPLSDEIDAIRMSDTRVGIALNWGRSALELRDPDRVVEHIALARDADLLRGFVFSGVSDSTEPHGRPWADAHQRFRLSDAHPHGDPLSLLTDERAENCVAALDAQTWLGAKMSWPAGVGTVGDRTEMIRQALDALDRAGAGERADPCASER
ncbi:MAG: DUF4862 family protein [Actinomycetaceae bacterium]